MIESIMYFGIGVLVAAERVNDFETPGVMRLASERV